MPLIQEQPDQEQGGGAPRYIVGYSSIMTLLLAFFIIMQAFASEQQEGLFYSGQGSFIRAIETLGLGGVWNDTRGSITGGSLSPRYPSEDDLKSPSALRRIDPEREKAQAALEELREEHQTGQPPRGQPWRVVFSTTLALPPAGEPLGESNIERVRETSRQLRRSLGLLLHQGCVVRVGATFYARDEEEAAHAARAAQVASRVERALLNSLSPQARRLARDRVYTWCLCRPPRQRPQEMEPGDIRVDIMLTRYPREGEQERP